MWRSKPGRLPKCISANGQVLTQLAAAMSHRSVCRVQNLAAAQWAGHLSNAQSLGQSARVSRYICRISSIRSSRSSLVQSCVGTGSRTATSTVPEWMTILWAAIISPQLRITIGTTGTPACIAMWNGPFLNGSSRDVGERVPSGAIAIERPLCNASTAGSRPLRAAALLERSM